jgi:hypothetical protein
MNNLVKMKNLIVVAFCIVLFSSAFAQDVTSAQPTTAQATGAQSHIPTPIEVLLKKYVTAYEERSVPDLLTIWPDLPNQKKEFSKIKDHFNDPKISGERMSLHPLETKILADDAVILCERNEQFSKAETKTDFYGDLRLGDSPGQSPPPTQTTSKKAVKKAEKIWVKLHKTSDGWIIVSITEKPQSL